jgi:hypothetical protein
MHLIHCTSKKRVEESQTKTNSTDRLKYIKSRYSEAIVTSFPVCGTPIVAEYATIDHWEKILKPSK